MPQARRVCLLSPTRPLVQHTCRLPPALARPRVIQLYAHSGYIYRIYTLPAFTQSPSLRPRPRGAGGVAAAPVHGTRGRGSPRTRTADARHIRGDTHARTVIIYFYTHTHTHTNHESRETCARLRVFFLRENPTLVRRCGVLSHAGGGAPGAVGVALQIALLVGGARSAAQVSLHIRNGCTAWRRAQQPCAAMAVVMAVRGGTIGGDDFLSFAALHNAQASSAPGKRPGLVTWADQKKSTENAMPKQAIETYGLNRVPGARGFTV